MPHLASSATRGSFLNRSVHGGQLVFVCRAFRDRGVVERVEVSGASRYTDVELAVAVLCREIFSFMSYSVHDRWIFIRFVAVRHTCVFLSLIVIGFDQMLDPRDIDRGGNSISIINSVCPKIALT